MKNTAGSPKKTPITLFCSASPADRIQVENWLVPSLLRQHGSLEISLYLINYTGNSETIYTGSTPPRFLKIFELAKGIPCGFGEAHNFAFAEIHPQNHFVIINPDVCMDENCLQELLRCKSASTRAGIVEARQLPFPHPKEFDPQTGRTPWASGCCALIDSKAFDELNGFDENYWMYTEDVDFSWRIWLSGREVIYHPAASIYHYTGVYFHYQTTRYYLEQYWTARNFLYILYKFWGAKGEKQAWELFQSSGYPSYFINDVAGAYRQFKAGLGNDSAFASLRKMVSKYAKWVKVSGFNQFHRLQNEDPL